MTIQRAFTRHLFAKIAFCGALASAVTLSSCGGGGAGAALSSSGLASFSLIDAPACSTVSDVYVTIAGVQLVGEQGTYTMTLPAPQLVDLVTLTNANTLSLGQISAPAGTYQRVNLLLAPTGTSTPYANYVVASGTSYPLTIPSGVQSGFKINGEFNLAANGQVNLTVDFNACRSVVMAGNSGQYILKPVLNLFDDDATGGVSGVVQTAPSAPTPGAVVMVENPTTGQVIRSTVTAADGSFSLPFLPVGTSYEVVISSPTGTTTPTPNIQSSVVTGVPVQAGTTTSLGSITVATASTDTTYGGNITLTNDDSNSAVVVVAQVSLSGSNAGLVTLMEGNAQQGSSNNQETYDMVLPGADPESLQVAAYSTTLPLAFTTASSLPVTLWAYAENGSSGSITPTSSQTTGANITMTTGSSTFESEDD